jgi:hypothetical protein
MIIEGMVHPHLGILGGRLWGNSSEGASFLEGLIRGLWLSSKLVRLPVTDIQSDAWVRRQGRFCINQRSPETTLKLENYLRLAGLNRFH